jgi:hypothetical protein
MVGASTAAMSSENQSKKVLNGDFSSDVASYLVNQETQRRAQDFALAPIKSRSDLTWYVNHMPPNSPLMALSEAGRRHFLSSVEFNRSGVTTFDYSDLRAELNATGIHQVLSLFGIQRVTSMMRGVHVDSEADRVIMESNSNFAAPMLNAGFGGGYIGIGEDHEGYKCEGHGTCASYPSRICTSNC